MHKLQKLQKLYINSNNYIYTTKTTHTLQNLHRNYKTTHKLQKTTHELQRTTHKLQQTTHKL